jgi:hypothetical protein
MPMRALTPSHALAGLNIVLLIVLVWTNARSQAPPEVHEVIRARLIEVVNERGEMRGQLHIAQNGGGELRLRNGQGEIRIKLGPTNDGGTALLMMDASTEPAAMLHTGASGPALTLTDPKRGKRVVAP